VTLRKCALISLSLNCGSQQLKDFTIVKYKRIFAHRHSESCGVAPNQNRDFAGIGKFVLMWNGLPPRWRV
jgi:hypothetical protein